MSSDSEAYSIEPGQTVSGSIGVPGDKSISHRALMLGAIAEGKTEIHGFLEGEDCLATLDALQAMNISTSMSDSGELTVFGAGAEGLQSPLEPIDLGNSGTGLRLMTGLLAGRGCEVVLTGDESLRSRPMERVAEPLRRMGASIETTEGRPPVTIHPAPPLEGIDYALPVASAQIKSALLLAALTANGPTRVQSPAATRDHTERMLRSMGAELAVSDDGLVVSLTGPQTLTGRRVDVPGDLSSAAFFIVAACLGTSDAVTIRGVGVNPTRAGVLTILEAMGARIERASERLLGAEPVADIVVRRSELRGLDVEPALVPLAIDELPVIFVAAAAARGRTVISGAAELRHKESDRISAMAQALTAVGVSVDERPDGLVIDGGRIRGGTVDSFGDHRIAMAFVAASLAAEAPIRILQTRNVATSFPGFVDSAAALGLAVRVEAAVNG